MNRTTDDFIGPPAPPPRPDPLATRQVRELKHNRPLLGCRFDPTGAYVFAGSEDNSIQRWALADGAKTTLAGHESWVRALAFRDRLLISGDYAGKIKFWELDAASPAPIRTIDAHDGWVRALAVSPDGRLLASCGNDNLVKLWDISRRPEGVNPPVRPIREFVGHTRHVYNVAFHPDGRQLVSCDLLGMVKHWDLSIQGAGVNAQVREFDCSVLHKYDTTFRASIGGARSMTFNRDGSQLALAGITNVTNAFAGVGNPVVVLFEWSSGRRLRLLQPAQAFQGTMWGVVHHANDYWIGAGGGSGGAMWFWRPEQEKSFHMVRLPNNGRDLALHPNGIRLAVPHYDGAVRFFDMTLRNQ